MDKDPGEIVNGSSFDFDPNVVSHWSQWLGHPSPRILVVGQDFSDSDYFERNRGADSPDNATNKNLSKLLELAGVKHQLEHQKVSEAPVYLTNSILCLKTPPMNRPISRGWVRNCATNHLRPLIVELKPEVIVGMGAHGWRAVCLALNLMDLPTAITAAAGNSWKIGNHYVCAVGHCGPLGLANRNWDKQAKDWKHIGELLGE